MERATRCLFVAASVSACGATWCAAAAEASASAALFLSLCPRGDLLVDMIFYCTTRSEGVACSSVSAHIHTLPTNLLSCLSPCKSPVATRTTHSLSDLISRFPSCTRIAAITARSFARLLVCSRPGKVKERFLSSPMLKKTAQAALLNLES